jgi:hypothetical protein
MSDVNLVPSCGGLSKLLDIADRTDGVKLGLPLWIEFPVVLWTGASCAKRSRRSSPPFTQATGC